MFRREEREREGSPEIAGLIDENDRQEPEIPINDPVDLDLIENPEGELPEVQPLLLIKNVSPVELRTQLRLHGVSSELQTGNLVSSYLKVLETSAKLMGLEPPHEDSPYDPVRDLMSPEWIVKLRQGLILESEIQALIEQNGISNEALLLRMLTRHEDKLNIKLGTLLLLHDLYVETDPFYSPLPEVPVTQQRGTARQSPSITSSAVKVKLTPYDPSKNQAFEWLEDAQFKLNISNLSDDDKIQLLLVNLAGDLRMYAQSIGFPSPGSISFQDYAKKLYEKIRTSSRVLQVKTRLDAYRYHKNIDVFEFVEGIKQDKKLIRPHVSDEEICSFIENLLPEEVRSRISDKEISENLEKVTNQLLIIEAENKRRLEREKERESVNRNSNNSKSDRRNYQGRPFNPQSKAQEQKSGPAQANTEKSPSKHSSQSTQGQKQKGGSSYSQRYCRRCNRRGHTDKLCRINPMPASDDSGQSQAASSQPPAEPRAQVVSADATCISSPRRTYYSSMCSTDKDLLPPHLRNRLAATIPVEFDTPDNASTLRTAALIDTGAEVCTIDHITAKKMNGNIQPTTTQLKGVAGSAVKMMGEMNTIVAPNNETTSFETKFFVIEHESPTIIIGIDL